MSTQNNTNNIVLWLWACTGLVFAMVIIGGITRLTNSGLSMVEWRPLIGAIPPMNEDEWNRVFTMYQSSPEFHKEHFWMELADFKKIFFWEWFHRLLGRLVGVVYGLPLIWFAVTKKIPKGWGFPLCIPFILGGMQGLMGWYMVKSGLVDVPSVSHFRLAAHLGLAFVIILSLVWLALSIRGVQSKPDRALFWHSVFAFLLLCGTIAWGAFTAGLDAGMIYNDSFPKMGETWLPAALINSKDIWYSLTHNHEAIQFAHRWLAITTVLITLSIWLHGALRRRSFPALHALAFITFLQFGLGMATLFSQVAIPIAAAHQAGGTLLFITLIICLKTTQPFSKN